MSDKKLAAGQRAHVELVDEPIDAGALASLIGHPDVGAQGWFHGVTRRTTGDQITQTLFYEAHEAMALKELEKLAHDALDRFDLKQIVVVHRLGEVPIGEASVVIGCCSAHRVQTFDALRWIMDTLKKDVPIWKKEHFEDGSTEWVHPTNEPSS